jgi:hypothetical protein
MESCFMRPKIKGLEITFWIRFQLISIRYSFSRGFTQSVRAAIVCLPRDFHTPSTISLCAVSSMFKPFWIVGAIRHGLKID